MAGRKEEEEVTPEKKRAHHQHHFFGKVSSAGGGPRLVGEDAGFFYGREEEAQEDQDHNNHDAADISPEKPRQNYYCPAPRMGMMSPSSMFAGIEDEPPVLRKGRGGEQRPQTCPSSETYYMAPRPVSAPGTPWGRGPVFGQPGAGKKSDPVARGQAMRAAWGRDTFLKSSSSRKFDLRPIHPPDMWGGTVQRRPPFASPQNLRPAYVPPHEKRRDSLRMNTRMRMTSGPPL